MPSDKMLSEKDGPIGWMTFNNPAKRNAVSLDMWEAAAEILTDFLNDDAIRVIVLTGAGGKAFVSGADISKFEDVRANAEMEARYHETLETARGILNNAAKPTIAMIRGYCIGGGVATALGCDLRICTEGSRFAVPAAKLGVGYDHGNIRRLMNLVGPSFTKEIFYTARQFSADEAFDMGLVDRVVPDAELEETVRDYATTIAKNAPLTIRAAQAAIDAAQMDEAERDEAALVAMVERAMASEDYKEGRRAFVEKREPVFKGR